MSGKYNLLLDRVQTAEDLGKKYTRKGVGLFLVTSGHRLMFVRINRIQHSIAHTQVWIPRRATTRERRHIICFHNEGII